MNSKQTRRKQRYAEIYVNEWEREGKWEEEGEKEKIVTIKTVSESNVGNSFA